MNWDADLKVLYTLVIKIYSCEEAWVYFLVNIVISIWHWEQMYYIIGDDLQQDVLVVQDDPGLGHLSSSAANHPQVFFHFPIKYVMN